jgi:hypothetical protein
VYSAFVLQACAGSNFLGEHTFLISSKGDIAKAKGNERDITLLTLPLEDYRYLAKFVNVQHLTMSSDGTYASDQMLKALAELGFTNLFDVCLLNCKRVTDSGISALTNLAALKMLQLEGTSITDDVGEILGSKTNFTGVNVANCSKITFKGLKKIAAIPSLEEFGFSAANLQDEDVLQIFEVSKNVKWCQIVDPARKLNEATLQRAAGQRSMNLVIVQKGAL